MLENPSCFLAPAEATVPVCRTATLACAAIFLGIAGGVAAQSYPSKRVEFVVHSGPGGGPDVFARAVTEMIARAKLLPQPAIVVNKPGGSGGIAFN